MTDIVWPSSLCPTEVALNTSPNNTSGGVSLNGTEQVVGNTPGRWRVTFGKIDIRTVAQVQAWNSLRAQLRGRLNPIKIPIFDKQRRPGGTGVTTTATANAAVASGAVSIGIVSNRVILAGMHFGHLNPATIYEIATVDSMVGSLYTCTIWPPVRTLGIGAGDTLDFNAPQLRVRLASDAEMDLSLELLKFGSPSVNFVEDLQ